MTVSYIFFNSFGRLRSGWRAAAFVALYIFITVVLGATAILILTALGYGAESGTAVFLTVNGLLSLIPALGVGWLCAKYLEGLPFRSLGASFTAGWLRNVVLGMVFGAATMAVAAAVAMAFGGLRFVPNNESSGTAIAFTLLTTLAVFAAAAAFEEALFRGYLFQTLLRSRHLPAALLITSLLFATVHNANPSASAFSWTNTFIAGIWFGVGYLKTRDLWFIFGLHLMWNWVQGPVLGIEVSGLTELMSAPLLRESDGGPDWLTGGSYGLEGGLAATAALIISTAAIWFSPFLKADEELVAMTSSEIPSGDQIV